MTKKRSTKKAKAAPKRAIKKTLSVAHIKVEPAGPTYKMSGSPTPIIHTRIVPAEGGHYEFSGPAASQSLPWQPGDQFIDPTVGFRRRDTLDNPMMQNPDTPLALRVAKESQPTAGTAPQPVASEIPVSADIVRAPLMPPGSGTAATSPTETTSPQGATGPTRPGPRDPTGALGWREEIERLAKETGDGEQAVLEHYVFGRLADMLEGRQGIAGPKGFKKDSKITRMVLEQYPRAQWWQFASPNDKLMAEIKALRKQYNEWKRLHQVVAVGAPPAIPDGRPAAVEPIWKKGRLTVSTKPLRSDLGTKKFVAALKALRTELRDFADSIGGEANIDGRFVSYVRNLVERIPQRSPPQHELFRLGHAQTAFAGYLKTANEQWPDFLLARYHALSLQFDQTMRQSPLWREFKRNAEKESLSADQISASIPLATETAHALRDGEATEFVDPAVPNSLEQLAHPWSAFGGPPPDAIGAAKELVAFDIVESVNNTLKGLTEGALSTIASGLRGVESTAADYANDTGKGFKRAAKKQAPKDGAKLFKWLRRVVIASPGIGAATVIARYPEAFAWLENVIKFLHK